MSNTWILVADRARARLFSRHDQEALTEIEDFFDAEARRPEHVGGRGPRPRTHESVGSARHAIEPHTSRREKTAQRFARDLREALERGRVEHAYDELILVAPPQFMGELHAAIGKELRERVRSEIGRDLTRLDPDAILEAISAPPG